MTIHDERYKQAHTEWSQLLARGVHPRILGLSQEQKENLHAPLTADIHALDGQYVLVGADTDGHLWNEYPYLGTVLRAKRLGASFSVRVSYKEGRNADRETVEGTFPLVSLFPLATLSPQELRTRRNKRVVSQFVASHTAAVAREQEYVDHYTRRIAEETRALTRNKQKLAEAQQQVKALAAEPAPTKTLLMRRLRQLTKHTSITAAALLATPTTLICETAPLVVVDKETGVPDPTKPLGRYVLHIDMAREEVYAVNLDYGASRRSLFAVEERCDGPFINDEGKVCLGDTAPHLWRLMKIGRFANVVDLLLCLFTVFPTSGDPYMSGAQWLSRRTVQSHPNPWLPIEDPFWHYGTFSPIVTDTPPQQAEEKRSPTMDALLRWATTSDVGGLP